MAKETILSLTHFEQAYLLDALIEYVETHEGFYKIQGKTFHQRSRAIQKTIDGVEEDR